MTSSERKIINCLWETKEKTHIRLIAQKANLSSDYARLLCRSLARSGHIEFKNDIAHLLKKESIKPSDGFGIILKKIVNWFAEKK